MSGACGICVAKSGGLVETARRMEQYSTAETDGVRHLPRPVEHRRIWARVGPTGSSLSLSVGEIPARCRCPSGSARFQLDGIVVRLSQQAFSSPSSPACPGEPFARRRCPSVSARFQLSVVVRLSRRGFSSTSLSACLGKLSARRRRPPARASFALGVVVRQSWRAFSSPSVPARTSIIGKCGTPPSILFATYSPAFRVILFLTCLVVFPGLGSESLFRTVGEHGERPIQGVVLE